MHPTSQIRPSPTVSSPESNRVVYAGVLPKLYQEDVVQHIGSSNSVGIVVRCWHDVEDDIPVQEMYSDPMLRPLQPGEVGVSFLKGGEERTILPESELRLVDRTIRPGDYCKRTVDDVQSGVVNNVHIKARVEHVISGEPVEGWKTADQLESRAQAEIGDYVLYDDWIGQVVELYDESTVEISTGRLVRLPELSSRLSVGEKGTDIIPTSPRSNFFGFPTWPATNRSDSVDTVVAVKHTAYAITWLAISQMLSPVEAEKKPRPKMFWYGQDIGKLTMFCGRVGSNMGMGDRVRLKDTAGVPFTKHGEEEGEPYRLHVFIVTETRTTVDVIWQDGTRENVKSTDVVPYLNPDECDCWPGDHVIWKGGDSGLPAVVQSVNALDRTAKILLPDSGTIELASLLDLDPTGSSDPAAFVSSSASEGLGVRRGDFVFIHREGTTNGFTKPIVPVIGELEEWVHQPALDDGLLTGWRKVLSDLGANIAAQRHIGAIVEAPIGYPTPGGVSFAWVGEVTNLNLDGTIQITHPDSTTKTYPLERLTKLHDAMEQLEDDLWSDEDSGSQDAQSEDDWSIDGRENGIGHSIRELRDLQAKETESEDRDTMKSEPREWGSDAIYEITKATTPGIPLSQVPNTSTDQKNETPAEGNIEDSGPMWKRFDTLASAPPDHAFISSSPSQPSKAFLSRLTKEYRALSSGLPESILVRVYEDRTDLLRSLIIGPASTPYEDAPFMIDWMLDSNFPYSPPIAHFHSWTNGNGRVNPNLYEEGKVCLSILGTWSGDRDESWNPARSSLLQAFVSIQGLVLVREPWFCEPAYEKLRGTEEGIVNSRLYNEKVFVLSRAFVRRALEIPLGGLDSEIKWFYYQNNRLSKVLRDAEKLIEKSPELSEAGLELAVPRLTMGGIIALNRSLSKLRALYNSSQSSS